MLQLPVLHSQPGARQVHVEVHAVDACGGVVLDAQVDVLSDAEAEGAVAREVDLPQLVLLHLEALLKNLLCLLPTYSHMACDLLIPSDAEGADGELRLGEDGLLLRELLQDLRDPRQAVAAFAHADVEAQLLDLDLAHGVVRLVWHGSTGWAPLLLHTAANRNCSRQNGL